MRLRRTLRDLMIILTMHDVIWPLDVDINRFHDVIWPLDVDINRFHDVIHPEKQDPTPCKQ